MAQCKTSVTQLLTHWSYYSLALSPDMVYSTCLLYLWATRFSHEACTLQLRHNERGSLSNHQRLDYLLSCWFRPRSRKHQSSASLTFVWGIHRWPVNSSHKRSVTRKMFPFDAVTMTRQNLIIVVLQHREAVYPIQYKIGIVVLCFVAVISLLLGPLFEN